MGNKIPKKELPNYGRRVLLKISLNSKSDRNFVWVIGCRKLTDEKGDKYEFEVDKNRTYWEQFERSVIDWQELPE